MKPVFIIAQIIGIFALVASVSSFQTDKRANILRLQATGSTLWVLHFFLLGGYTGSLLNLINVTKCIVYLCAPKYKWAKSKAWLYVFLIACPIICYFTWNGVFSLFPCIAMMLTTISLYVKNTRIVRFLTFPASPLWIVYNLYNASYPGVITELCVMLSIAAAIIRFDVLKHNTKT